MPQWLLDFPFAGSGPRERWTFHKPKDVLVAMRPDMVLPVLETATRRARTEGCYAVGFVTYEAAVGLDSALTVKGNAEMPLVWLGLYTHPVRSLTPTAAKAPTKPMGPWTASVSEAAYRVHIAAIQDAIRSGDTYQTNYTLRLVAPLPEDAGLAWYEHLSPSHSVYGAYGHIGRWEMVCLSPELFFELQGDQLTTRPMKGTSRRGRWLGEDQALADALRHSPKEQAENLMVVDLLRNDMGKVAAWGSVEVPHHLEVEPYPTVLQMTSTITARVAPGLGVPDCFRALFPSGSVTGVPKVSTMARIASWEDTPREVYCGSIGIIHPNGDAMFNVAIRTLQLDHAKKQAVYGVGGGITADSSPAGEYQEVWTKAAVLFSQNPVSPPTLLETLAWDGTRYVLLDRHLDRMAASRRYFGRPFQRSQALAHLEHHARQYPYQARRVRLLLDDEAGYTVESRPLEPLPPGPKWVRWATQPISPEDVTRYHKTTARSAYDAARADYPDAFDVLLWNTAGEAAEFCLANLVVRLDGTLWTPPLESGCLPGTLRTECLARGIIRERRLDRGQVAQADALWWINGVRGWVEVRLQPETAATRDAAPPPPTAGQPR